MCIRDSFQVIRHFIGLDVREFAGRPKLESHIGRAGADLRVPSKEQDVLIAIGFSATAIFLELYSSVN